MVKQSKPKEIEIESIETPKGTVPTVKGLETVVNALVGQITPLGEAIKGIHAELSNVRSTLDNALMPLIQQIGDNLGEFLVILAKINSNIQDALEQIKNAKMEGFEDKQNMLIELQTILAKILVQFQTLPVLEQSIKE